MMEFSLFAFPDFTALKTTRNGSKTGSRENAWFLTPKSGSAVKTLAPDARKRDSRENTWFLTPNSGATVKTQEFLTPKSVTTVSTNGP